MEIMYILLPVSIVLVLAILGVLAWAIFGGQFEELDQEGLRILREADAEQANVDRHQD